MSGFVLFQRKKNPQPVDNVCAVPTTDRPTANPAEKVVPMHGKNYGVLEIIYKRFERLVFAAGC